MKKLFVTMLLAGMTLGAVQVQAAGTEAASEAETAVSEASAEETAEETSAEEETAEEGSAEEETEEEIECIGEHYTIEVNGVSLYYEVAGEGKPVVLVHGNGGNHKVFYVEIQQLVDAGYQVYALDSRGQGENEPLDEYHYADMAEDVYQFIETLGLEQPAYYGWSDGGIIGLTLEIAHPNTLSLMAISGTNLTPDGADPDLIAALAEENETNPQPLTTLMLTEPNIDPEELSAIEIPVLVTAGSNDLILSEHTQLIAESIPNAELKIVDGEDHGSYIQGSEIMGNLLLDFLSEHNY